jgi:hypothetical protein
MTELLAGWLHDEVRVIATCWVLQTKRGINKAVKLWNHDCIDAQIVPSDSEGTWREGLYI